MKKAEIKVGGRYLAKVNDAIVVVRVDVIEARFGGGDSYHVTNMKTGRTTTFRSAAKFRGLAPEDPNPAVNAAAGKGKIKAAEKIMRDDGLGRLIADALCEPDSNAHVSCPGEAKALAEINREATGGGQHRTPKPSDVEEPVDFQHRPAFAVKGTTAVPGLPDPQNAVKTGLAGRLAARAGTDSAPHLVIRARAGTGKTTTLIEALKVLTAGASALTPSPQQQAVWDAVALSRGHVKTIAFVAFNKSIADELRRRVPAGVDAMTNHGLGNRAVAAAFPGIKLNEYRADDIIGRLMGVDSRDLRRLKPGLVPAVKQLVSLCKMNLLRGEEDELDTLVDHFDIDMDGVSRTEAFGLVPRVLDACRDVEADRQMDFNDTIWLPVALRLPVKKYDILMVDEFQDTNRCQQELVKMAGRRIVACGDDRQAIYGFAGADSKAMDRFIEEMGATDRGVEVIPLTVTRRCGKAIVEEAKRIVPDFEAFGTNPPGEIRRAFLKTDDPNRAGNWYGKIVTDGDMVLCRVNAPLVSECFKFIKAGRKANIQGRDVGKGLVSLVEKAKAASVTEFVGWLGRWLDDEQRKEAAKKNPNEAKLVAIQDRHDCLLCFTDGLGAGDHPQRIVDKINAIFTDDKAAAGIRLSSIHKAKGLEAKRVFLLEPEGAGVPHPMAKKAWAVGQEWNLRYVAITRAIEELVYVS